MWLLLFFVGNHACGLGTWWMSCPLGYHGQAWMNTLIKSRTTMMHLAIGSYGDLIHHKRNKGQISISIWVILGKYWHIFFTLIDDAFNL